jgi:hypothetical protein
MSQETTTVNVEMDTLILVTRFAQVIYLLNNPYKHARINVPIVSMTAHIV